MGLSVNIQKTQIISHLSAQIPPVQPVFRLAGEEIVQIPSFTYLGSFLSETANIDDEVQYRLRQATTSFGRLQKRVYQNSHLTLRTKVAVYNAMCKTALLYGCETWTINRRHLRPPEAFHIRYLQKIMGISW